ncbi:universal stress protein [Natronosalvus halobius]|uniref:universal stress protein n=1 Tax=Natronosalvus halobius TaxID=2953746 RepID=UPI00209F5646|nr:universal stress protein [Natronosalvus halobius]USZ72634.1 universal stress protein [Natronosalvus halobius]
MYDFLLVPVDGSDASSVALEYALEIAADHDATVHLLYVADTNKPSHVRYEANVVDVLEDAGEDVLQDARERAEVHGVSTVTDTIQGQPRTVITEAAAEDVVDLVVMGTSGERSLTEHVLGSVTEHVVNASDEPVLAVRAASDASKPYPYENVLVPTDGSEHAERALELAGEIVREHCATLHVLTVVQDSLFGIGADSSDETTTASRDRARDALSETAETMRSAGVDEVTTTVESGSVPQAIRSYAVEHGIDLIAMGTHGRSELDQRLLGSRTERMLRITPVPVLTTSRPGSINDQ